MEKKASSLFVTCADGLESLLEEELLELGFSKLRKGFRGIYVEGGIRDVYSLNYCSRIASRVLWPIKRFNCGDREDLYRYARSIDWKAYMSENETFAIDANVNHGKLKNSLFAIQVVKDAICDFFRAEVSKRPNVDVRGGDVRFNLFIDRGVAIISLDTSGVALFKRGYRFGSVAAPLQETLAAAILRLTGYRGDRVLLDLCCGSGTFLIEAALIASNTAPGYLRKKWGFSHLPDFSQKDWFLFKAEVDEKRKSLPKDLLFGIDIDSEAISSAKKNLRKAGFGDEVSFSQADLFQYSPRVSPSMIICNPPYGKRLEDEESLYSLYRELGYVMGRICQRPGKGFVFSGNSKLSKAIRLKVTRRHVLKNSGIDCRLLEYDFIPKDTFRVKT